MGAEVFDTTMTTLKERLAERQAPTGDVSAHEPDAKPDTTLGPRHAATPYTTRGGFDVTRIVYGVQGQASLPYAYLAMADMPEPGVLLLEFASCSVRIEGIRLDALLTEIDRRRVSVIRASDAPEFDTGVGWLIQRVTLTRPA